MVSTITKCLNECDATVETLGQTKNNFNKK